MILYIPFIAEATEYETLLDILPHVEIGITELMLTACDVSSNERQFDMSNPAPRLTCEETIILAYALTFISSVLSSNYGKRYSVSQ
ncbi:hypothetical protein EUGRSUZ_I02429 [Eucalyptus grandis]|uniref:Uncharacterized protein n=2 Tax=Eucalyptus grandis TaxID=71139 RepID=A0ACC3JL50_EUCGR|nr:hypothetical protein EUGRSUZ_I02429 [Eucalyptus grandis]